MKIQKLQKLKKFSLKKFQVNFLTLFISLNLLSLHTHAVHSETKLDSQMVSSLVNIKFQNGMCSGVILSENVIMTAAHCRDHNGNAEFVVSYAKENIEKCDISNVVSEAYAPNAKPLFPLNVHAPDILLLQIESPLCSGVPAKLKKGPLVNGDKVFHAGYGGNRKEDFYASYQLSLNVIDYSSAEDLIDKDIPIYERVYDVGADYYQLALPVVANTTSCDGDSGGPVFVNVGGEMYVHGVMGSVLPNEDLGVKECDNRYLHFFSPVTPYYEWISSQIKKWQLDT